ncbi:acetylxylan esterase [Deinococcus hopiensis]|uniref:Cephalosporin-C deacetylase n=1 Tax=Deinococcus hopiensis KR-140 TaxID=695939 RepID=A0A1W1UAR0_9DEIO|nr:acetylxylan esterase [Deinococcus hopiensis]SMB78175.1 cephalosporin-C deacetylase [Deinococcus hopiensis KR-140]
MQFDFPRTELERYRPDEAPPADFNSFWASTLTEARDFDLNPRFNPVRTPLRQIEVQDVTYTGFGGAPIKGWLLLPSGTEGPLPCVVEYTGYGGGRGYPTDWLLWASLGYAHFVMDTRGQGTTWRQGDTPDPQAGGEPHFPGFMTQGILGRNAYYYRRVYTDAVRAIEAARAHPRVDSSRIAVTGGSQGGGIALAAAGLVPDVELCMADVPFLCHFSRAVTLTDDAPFSEIARYLRTHRARVEEAMTTLQYFDGIHFAARAQARALFSVGLMDTVCPPSTVYAAYNHYGGPREIRVYPFNGHEGGENQHTLEKMNFLTTHLPLQPEQPA